MRDNEVVSEYEVCPFSLHPFDTFYINFNCDSNLCRTYILLQSCVKQNCSLVKGLWKSNIESIESLKDHHEHHLTSFSEMEIM